MITSELIIERLKTVIDPELHVNIVDLGLIYDVKVKQVEDKYSVSILMTLTTPGCPLAGTIQLMIKDALFPIKELDVDQDVDIEITFDPPWTIDMMDEKTRVDLGFL